ncbi:MAG: hypothetical protein LBP59_15880 [Planctomycetaceae bacterium]|nr:hypothetical protein [Planctomycetaceae bacterium]
MSQDDNTSPIINSDEFIQDDAKRQEIDFDQVFDLEETELLPAENGGDKKNPSDANFSLIDDDLLINDDANAYNLDDDFVNDKNHVDNNVDGNIVADNSDVEVSDNLNEIGENLSSENISDVNLSDINFGDDAVGLSAVSSDVGGDQFVLDDDVLDDNFVDDNFEAIFAGDNLDDNLNGQSESILSDSFINEEDTAIIDFPYSQTIESSVNEPMGEAAAESISQPISQSIDEDELGFNFGDVVDNSQAVDPFLGEINLGGLSGGLSESESGSDVATFSGLPEFPVMESGNGNEDSDAGNDEAGNEVIGLGGVVVGGGLGEANQVGGDGGKSSRRKIKAGEIFAQWLLLISGGCAIGVEGVICVIVFVLLFLWLLFMNLRIFWLPVGVNISSGSLIIYVVMLNLSGVCGLLVPAWMFFNRGLRDDKRDMKDRNDVFRAMLGVGLIVISVGVILLASEWLLYDFKIKAGNYSPLPVPNTVTEIPEIKPIQKKENNKYDETIKTLNNQKDDK